MIYNGDFGRYSHDLKYFNLITHIDGCLILNRDKPNIRMDNLESVRSNVNLIDRNGNLPKLKYVGGDLHLDSSSCDLNSLEVVKGNIYFGYDGMLPLYNGQIPKLKLVNNRKYSWKKQL